ncbi:MAG: hypothetical protein QM667_07670, partial [Asticcacaulis sp.]
MLLFAFASALLSAALLGLAALWLRRRPVAALEQARARYESFAAETDRRVEAGYADAALAQAEKAEAARALLDIADADATPPLDPRAGFLGAVVIAAAALGVYLLAGSPGLPDQPYAARLKGWVSAMKTAPETLEAKPMAMAMGTLSTTYGDKAGYWMALGQVQVAAGDYYEASSSFQQVTKLAPEAAEGWSNLGEALTLLNKGESGPEARSAFAEALTRDGEDLTALYYSAKILSADGRYDQARRLYTHVLSTLAADDSRRGVVAGELEALDQSARTAATVQAQIGGMVAGLETRLKASPEDPDGWARLVRSYRVLKNVEGEKAALAAIDRIYAARPEIARDILQKAEQPVGA